MIFFWNLVGIGLVAKHKYVIALIFTALVSLVLLCQALNAEDDSNALYNNSNWAGKLVLGSLAYGLTWTIVSGFDFTLGYFIGELLNA